LCIGGPPSIITHCTPITIFAQLHSPLIGCKTTNQTNVTIAASCRIDNANHQWKAVDTLPTKEIMHVIFLYNLRANLAAQEQNMLQGEEIDNITGIFMNNSTSL